MVALQHAYLGHVLESEGSVRGRVVEFGGIEKPAVQRRHDLSAGQRVHRRTHSSEEVNRDPDSAELHTLEIVGFCYRLLIPAEWLRRHRAIRIGNHIGADRLVDLVEQLLTTAVLVPGEDHVGVHAISGTRTPERERILLAVMIGEHSMSPVKGTLRHGVEHAESRYYRAGGQHLDLQVATGHLVDFLGVVERELVEDILLRPSALKAH